MTRSAPIALLLLAAALLAATPCVARATDDPAQEYAVKAALVFNFARFSDWPGLGRDDTTLCLCVFDDPGMREAFAAVDGRRIGDRAIRVRYVADAREIGDCHLVFLPGSDRERWQSVRAALGDRPVLTIGEMNGFLDAGGIMNLSIVDGRIEFQVNLAAARRVGVSISSRILKLASEIEGGER